MLRATRLIAQTVAALALAAGLAAYADVRAEDSLKLSRSLSLGAAPATQPAPPAAAKGAAAAPAPATATPSVASAAPVIQTPPTVQPLDATRQYRIGEDDLLEIRVFGVDQLNSTVRVNPLGQVTLPLIGVVAVGGLTSMEAERLIARLLRETYLQNPQVSLFIREYTTQRVTVEGAVNRPGVYPLRGQSTLLTSLALAGGPARMAETTQVMLFRPDGHGGRVGTFHNLDLIRTGEVADPPVLNDDLIVVNRTGSRVFLRDSLFGDIVDVLNPFRYVPAP